ncbi:NB-ARC domain-containing protein [Hwangdonia lutea]|uniref:NB-ARC domain-containing protein n=1 Tax=Hwangdonia lutea TaxID=3075823 RepID=A0AA97HQ70_9FLAO|nr:NB-ARC domain-containing protein [Hwangdonia sp. SCSIO 19198]WOD43741.1 NB-ARC domain-containing protein [Hwangdonia sp. SCSIO 19198]
MNYIFNQIEKRINFLKSDSQDSELRVYYQSKFEFSLIYVLAYLWNKNWSSIDINEREYVVNCILKPSIGTIVSIIRKLDIENEFFGNKKLKKLSNFIDKYPNFRNEKIGHGYSFDDDTEAYLEFFEEFFDELETKNLNIIFDNCDIIKVTKKEENLFKGISYKPDGVTYLAWSCPQEIFDFEIGDIYLYTIENNYIRISPFILIESESEFYSFCSIEEKLTGRTKYNRLLKTAHLTSDVLEFERLSLSTDNSKRKSANGTVINLFENNFKKYIDIGITKNIIQFLSKNRSSVFATIWGHGGVGKTASIQRVCEILCNQERKLFDYIIFLSAKDRYYNYYQGKINPINDGISSLEDIISTVNSIIFNNADFDIELVKNYQGKLLIIIDDFETFTKNEKDRIVTFIKQLDINHHKVVLTTRAATLITGEEIQTKELDENETIIFLKEAVYNEIPSYNTKLLDKELKKAEIKKKIFQITSGRPLFILQLAIFAAQKGSILDALNTEIKTTKEALNFLYDRIYDYLSTDAKNMFLAISLLVDENDLSGLTSNLKFILSMEDKEDEFQNSLNELIKLKIITVQDKDFFKVYSPEIYKLMKLYYLNKGSEFDGNITNRFNLINTDKGSSTETALLENADASRLIESETEIENRYRYILNREKAPYSIKKLALLNFASYLITHKNKFDKALKLYQDYFQIFRKDSDYNRNYATCAWSEGSDESRYKAVQIIQDYFTTKPKINQETYLELLGILMTYKSILVVSERDELKSKLRFKEITKSQYDILYREQRERFRDIFKYPGGHLYKVIKEIDLMTLSANCRNYVLDGLTHFIEICIRTNKREVGKEVCHKVISEMPQNYQNPFIYKLNKIEFIESPEKYDNDIQKVMQNKTVGILGEKLKEALSKK